MIDSMNWDKLAGLSWEEFEPYVRGVLEQATGRLQDQLSAVEPDRIPCASCQGTGRVTRALEHAVGLELARSVLVLCLQCDGTGWVPGRHPVATAFDITVRELYRTLAARGQVYGEDVLALLGETGFVVMAVTKVMRILWGYNHGQPADTRADSWLDLAGYAVLCIALQKFLAAGGKFGSTQIDHGLAPAAQS